MDNEPSELPEADPEMSAAVAEAQQVSAFPPRADEAPPGSITPPGNDAFANATFMRVGPEIEQLVDEVLAYDELSDLAGHAHAVVWRKKSKPDRADGSPKLAEATPAPALWRFLTEGAYAFTIDLYWAHFDDLRDESNFVHPLTLQQHVHHALLGLEVSDEGNVTRGPGPTAMYPESVKRFGAWTPGMAHIKNQLELWPGSDE